MNYLSAARIAGEVGLAGGTITGGCCAAKYANEIVVVTKKKDKAEEDKRVAEQAKSNAENQQSNYSNGIRSLGMLQWLINEYVMGKMNNIDADLKKKLADFNQCIHDYLADNTNATCIKDKENVDTYGLTDKLRALGFSFS